MFLNLLFRSPVLALAWLCSIVIALTIHEFSHALVAKWRGDSTAEREGRLSLNPLVHIDLFGFLPLLVLGFGWAKPVPFNPYNLQNPKWDSVLVALAGPASNLFFAMVSAVAFRWLLSNQWTEITSVLSAFLFLNVLINLFLLFFNVIPIHPLDGSKLFFALFSAPKWENLRQWVAVRGPQVLFFFIILSLLGFNVFFFVSLPAFFICNEFLGNSCIQFLGTFLL
ncbi:site-2 protease family protein [Candidatus Uhrbacteria bacterium CG_4_9_14_3_um_filter_36_7]|uniref:Site-2 protease family protein n=1 Tax=Candidatus Uhrbacteria bacterium CG_4_9_14_3_um_filter_36_7 TaxID=1975033 RepID=A0A2M7XHL2_9BACT|nr:MAG: site-2 protease family protein [Candidatus Uhrbacteria bacterium CG_4_9_14_3_um_filter_36_7]